VANAEKAAEEAEKLAERTEEVGTHAHVNTDTAANMYWCTRVHTDIYMQALVCSRVQFVSLPVSSNFKFVIEE
jgi:hypothetical protein